ncbi:Ldh family oxidoreductase [Streptomyces sp. SPB4]|uniref:Ldh family oxidoreductase n=1 Tax=Streptomyces sp. SPB4 TaxID=2940553 RepID=UPI0024754DDA|nr:Ldh family oxidoreductase [Streptomyces sp. SPB4]MDH6545101.1 LDH2 family malate/lactate/ureidoglycolate dehydrogenase [Streptomyces sp. SPB4]
MIRVSAAALTAYLEAAYRAAGMSRSGARTMAGAHVEAEARGLAGHGIRLAPGYLDKLRTGRLNPRPKITSRASGSAALALNADLAPGPVAARYALGAATVRARRTGAGIVTVRNAGHAGALGVCATWAARHGIVALVAAQTSAASVALHGGSGRPVLGNSAVAIAIPGQEGTEPVVADLAAAGAMSWGSVHQYAALGLDLPPGTALDAAGQATTDPAEAAVLLPAGERSQGLAIVLELLVGALTSSTPLPADEDGRGLLCLAIDPRRLGVTHLADGVAQLAQAIRCDGARMPGDRTWATRTTATTAGLLVAEEDLHTLITAAGPTPAAPASTPAHHPGAAGTAAEES